ncbi:D-galactosamine-6-phosphate deaminase AgaS [Thalassocella blandensis]|nr:D-galactosamine-6-phosphate deaminase AgaS [Thalassocella blandensis]
MNFLNYSEQILKDKDAYWTAKEICQQPQCWEAVTQQVLSDEKLSAFLQGALATPGLRIILTGAGTSAFAGQCLTPVLQSLLHTHVEAIPTTDLVSNPSQYFQRKTPTLIVSFARSGNSPESVATVDIAEQCVEQCFQLAITCNKEGELYKRCTGEKRFALNLPDETNDVGFAMTSSFSSMMLSALIAFMNAHSQSAKSATTNTAESIAGAVSQITASTQALIEQASSQLSVLAEKRYSRIVYLGSGTFRGLAQESALKMLELADGNVISFFDSPLGFRHGPKAIVNNETLVIIFLSNDPYTRQYDLDLVKELRLDNEAGDIVVIDAQVKPTQLHSNPHTIALTQASDLADHYLLFPYVVCAQILALHSSIALGNTPDNPSSSGTINRVVKGVNIYPLTLESPSTEHGNI